MDGAEVPAASLRYQSNGTTLRKLFAKVKPSPTVHPSEPTAPQNSELLIRDPLRKIRVIRFPPKHSHAGESLIVEERQSWTEDYWFTRWTKPLKQQINRDDGNQESVRLGRCGCSFRRSQRRRSTIPAASNTRATAVSASRDRYIERLVADCIAEVLRELSHHQRAPPAALPADAHGIPTLGVDNAAYLQEGDDQCPVHSNDSQRRSRSRSRSRARVFLYHGIGSGADVWESVGDTLAAHGYDVYAPDMLGHGFSSTPNRPRLYTFKSLLTDALFVFDHYARAGDKCIVIGHSYGCSLATALARARPQLTVQLVLISGGGPTPLCAPAHDPDAPDAAHPVAARLGRIARSVFIAPLLLCGVRRQLFYAPRGKCHAPCPVGAGEGKGAVPGHVIRYACAGQYWPQGDAALHRRILVPTLLVHGLQDEHVTLVQECEMERTIPRAFLELLPNVGHMAMLENPERLSHMILCFMDWWHR